MGLAAGGAAAAGTAAAAGSAATAAATAAAISGATAAISAVPTALTAGAALGGAASAGVSAASVLSTVGTVGAALGGITGAIGAINTAEANKASASYQAQVAANNALIANNQANQTAAAGASAVEQQGLKTRANVGAIKAAQAASNVDVNTGSAVDVRSSAAELGELDALTIRSNTAKQAYGEQTEAASSTAQGQLLQAQSSNALVAGGINATSSLLSGATSVANQYSRWQQAAGGTQALF